MEWTGTVENVTIATEPATKTQTKIKRVVYDKLQITKTGQYLRGGDNEN